MFRSLKEMAWKAEGRENKYCHVFGPDSHWTLHHMTKRETPKQTCYPYRCTAFNRKPAAAPTAQPAESRSCENHKRCAVLPAPLNPTLLCLPASPRPPIRDPEFHTPSAVPPSPT